MKNTWPSRTTPHFIRCDLIPPSAGLTLSGQIERGRFVQAWGIPGCGLIALVCVKGSGEVWLGFIADERCLRRLSRAIQAADSRPVWIVAHLVESEINLIGAIDVEVA